MSLVPYKVTAIKKADPTGNNILAGASVSITKPLGGYAQLWDDEAGTIARGNPFTVDDNGERQVWLLPSEYSVVVSGGQAWNIKLSGGGDIQHISNVAALSSTPVIDGKVYYLLEYVFGTVKGGGHLVGKSGSTTYDNVMTFAGLGGYFLRINVDEIDVAMAGCIGSGDEYTKLQKAIDAAIAYNYPLTGVGTFNTNGGVLIANTKINIIGNGDAITDQFTLTTSSAQDLLKIRGSNSAIEGVHFIHTGSSGVSLSVENCFNVSVSKNRFTSSHASSTDPILYFNGSNTYVKNNRFDNFRPNAYCIYCDRTSYGININSNIDDNYLAGTGNGLRVFSSDTTGRPEGVSWINNECILPKTQVYIASCLSFLARGNMMDQAIDYNYFLTPNAASDGGIDLITIEDRYIATASGSVGTSIYYDFTATGHLRYLDVIGCDIDGPGNGIVIGGGDTEYINVDGVKCKNTSSTNLLISGVKTSAKVINSTFVGIVSIADGAASGEVFVDANTFAQTSTLSVTKTVEANVHVLRNIGKRTYSRVTGDSATLTTSGFFNININHGLGGTPDLTKCQISARVKSGVLTNITTSIIGADATVIAIQCFYTHSSDGVIAINAECYQY